MSCAVGNDAAAAFEVWRERALQSVRSLLVEQPTLILVPLTTRAVVIAGGTAAERRIELDATTTCVHVRSANWSR